MSFTAINTKCDKQLKAKEDTTEAKPELLWQPIPNSPQEQAYYSQADELFYGGQAGGGKSDLLLGLALTQHSDGIIYRREYPQLKGIIKRSKEINSGYGSYNHMEKMWTLPSSKFLEFGAVKYEDDWEKFAGRAHDLIGFDELAHFPYSLYKPLTGWLRSAIPGQRSRIVCTGNPPTKEDGEWIIDYWAPWLNPEHPNPALPGELRWYATAGDECFEVESGESFEYEGEIIKPLSRTFIPAALSDNPYLSQTNYRAVLQGLPEPLRSQLLYGDFGIRKQEDDPWQLFPTAWVEQAMARWVEPIYSELSALGLDVARGGSNKTVIAPRYDWVIGSLHKYPGSSTPDGDASGQLAIAHLKDNAYINVDVVGVGSSVYDYLKRNDQLRVFALNGGQSTEERDRSGNLGFVNLRSFWHWQLRQQLEPGYNNEIALPPDPELKRQMTGLRWYVNHRSEIGVERKEDMIKRLARKGKSAVSPDCSDAVVYAFVEEDDKYDAWWRDN
jgi:hypothetical protein